MKKGFTMIELIFVIVILGILAAVAIPKLAATRDDAKAASIKTDIGTAIQAVPSWYQGQKEASFLNAMSLDTNVWKKDDTTPSCSYVYKDGASDTITMSINMGDSNTSLSHIGKPITNCEETNTSVLGNAPFLRVQIASSGNGIINTLVSDMGVPLDSNITLAGKKVKW